MSKSRRNTLSYIRRTNGLTQGATNTNVIIYGTAAEFNGNDITYVNSAANGDSFLINTPGAYSVSVSTQPSASNTGVEIRIGSTVDNTNNDSNTRAAVQTYSTNGNCIINWAGFIEAGQLVWVYVGGTSPAGSVVRNQISIVKAA